MDILRNDNVIKYCLKKHKIVAMTLDCSGQLLRNIWLTFHSIKRKVAKWNKSGLISVSRGLAQFILFAPVLSFIYCLIAAYTTPNQVYWSIFISNLYIFGNVLYMEKVFFVRWYLISTPINFSMACTLTVESIILHYPCQKPLRNHKDLESFGQRQ